ncbi:MAG: CotH kinase family protein [Methanocorpusculum sp.]|nr:CotH kinase family protein [Methanocorpusculum sp.]
MKYINAVTLILAVCAVIFTAVFMFAPSALGISEKATLYEAKFFDADTVNTVNITISQENWESMLANPLAEEFHMCDVTVNGEVYTSVAVRTKGMTSLSQVASSDSDRYSFKIKADEYVSGQSFFGLDEFVLNNCYQDATYMKEFLSYEMMTGMGVPSPLYSFAAVYVNGEYWGLYLMVEAVEEDFAYRSFGSGYGELYKPESMNGGGAGNEMPGGNMPEQAGGMNRTGMMGVPAGMIQNMTPEMPMDFAGFNRTERPEGEGGFGGGDMGGFGGSGGGADLVYSDENVSSYSQIFDNAVFDGVTKADKSRVVDALRNLNAGTDLERYVDVDEVLRYFAVNTALVNLDSYVSGLKHNYYLYESGGRISIVPWDYNLAFGAFQSGSASDAVNFPVDTPLAAGLSASERPLIGSLLAVDAYAEQYHAYVREVAEKYFGAAMAERIDYLDSLIGEYVRADPTAFYSYEEYRAGVSALKVYGELRAESLLGQLDGSVPSTHEGQSASPEKLTDASGLNMSALGTMTGGGGGKGGFGKGDIN